MLSQMSLLTTASRQLPALRSLQARKIFSRSAFAITKSKCKNSFRENLYFQRCYASLATERTGRYPQRTSWSHPHLLSRSEITPGITIDEYATRRRQLAALLKPNSMAIVCGHGDTYMTNDIPYVFHQNTNLLYLSGVVEPETAMILYKSKNDEINYLLFSRPRDEHRAIWDGPRAGIEGMLSYFHADEAYNIDDMKKHIQRFSTTVDHIYFDNDRLATSSLASSQVQHQVYSALQSTTQCVTPLQPLISSLRLVKSPAECQILQNANDITGKAFQSMLAFCGSQAQQSSYSESTLEAHFEYIARLHGAQRVSYPPVFAYDHNALTLHYIQNDSLVIPSHGKLMLVDAGISYNHYVSDVTRVFPVSSKFSEPQLDLYNAVLETQLSCLAYCNNKMRKQSAFSLNDLQRYCVAELQRNLTQIGFGPCLAQNPNLLSGSLFPHHVGHYLGLDVHDTNDISRNIPLPSFSTITIEPGVYVSENNPAFPKHFQGMGIRIEDDVVLGWANSEEYDDITILSSSSPKSAKAIEQIMQNGI